MSRWRNALFVLIAACLFAACGEGGEPPAGRDHGTWTPLPAAGDGTIQWRGRLPCLDCQAIDTRLLLDRRGDEHRYRLVEVYVAAEGSMRFEEAGSWRLDETVLSLEPEDGGLRRYGVVHGGMLQVRDQRGRELPGRERDLLLPIGPHP